MRYYGNGGDTRCSYERIVFLKKKFLKNWLHFDSCKIGSPKKKKKKNDLTLTHIE